MSPVSGAAPAPRQPQRARGTSVAAANDRHDAIARDPDLVRKRELLSGRHETLGWNAHWLPRA